MTKNTHQWDIIAPSTITSTWSKWHMKSAKIVASALAIELQVPEKNRSDAVVSRPEIICPDLTLNHSKSCPIQKVPVI